MSTGRDGRAAALFRNSQARVKPKEIRAVLTYPSRWGPGKVHAVVYFRHRLWDRGWFPICTMEPVHAGWSVKVRRRDLGAVVTCRHCKRALVAQGIMPQAAVYPPSTAAYRSRAHLLESVAPQAISGLATTEGSGRRLPSVMGESEIACETRDLSS